MAVRVRYAPSPTGDLHLGSLRTVIFDYLFARHQGGQFLLRIEDTDQARTVEGAVERQLEALRWLGLEPDEGVCLDEQGTVVEKGPFGPYTQSKRLPIYRQHADQLLASGAAYRCFCTPERLEAMRAEQQAKHLPPRYDRHCRSLPAAESERRAAAGEPHVIRQAMPEEGEVVCQDVVRGEVRFACADLDDQVLLKSDGFPTYQLANVVDDHLMEISHVLRGEEWLPSLPKNILLYQAFGWQPPAFAHLPVILGPDGKHKLAKRDGSEPILTYRERGYLPQALVNVLAFVGWSPGTEEEFFSLDELIQRFSLERVQKAPAAFSFDRLEYVNGWYIRQLPLEKVVEGMLPFLVGAGLLRQSGQGYELLGDLILPTFDLNQYLRRVAGLVQERLKHFDETVEAAGFFFERPTLSPEFLELLVPKKGNLPATVAILREVRVFLEAEVSQPWIEEELEEKLRGFVVEKGYRNGDVLWPVRVALTGAAASPGAFEMLAALGREESLQRLLTVEEAA